MLWLVVVAVVRAADPAAAAAGALPGGHRGRRAAARPVAEDPGRPAAPGGRRAGGVGARQQLPERARARLDRRLRRPGAGLPGRGAAAVAQSVHRRAGGADRRRSGSPGSRSACTTSPTCWPAGCSARPGSASPRTPSGSGAARPASPSRRSTEGLEPEAGRRLGPAPDEQRAAAAPVGQGRRDPHRLGAHLRRPVRARLRAHPVHRGHLAGPDRRRRAAVAAELPHRRRWTISATPGARPATRTRSLWWRWRSARSRWPSGGSGGRCCSWCWPWSARSPCSCARRPRCSAPARRWSSWTARCPPRRSRPGTSPRPCASGWRSRSW